MATRSALVCPGGSFFDLPPTPNSKSYQLIFNFILFSEDAPFIFGQVLKSW